MEKYVLNTVLEGTYERYTYIPNAEVRTENIVHVSSHAHERALNQLHNYEHGTLHVGIPTR